MSYIAKSAAELRAARKSVASRYTNASDALPEQGMALEMYGVQQQGMAYGNAMLFGNGEIQTTPLQQMHPQPEQGMTLDKYVLQQQGIAFGNDKMHANAYQQQLPTNVIQEPQPNATQQLQATTLQQLFVNNNHVYKPVSLKCAFGGGPAHAPILPTSASQFSQAPQNEKVEQQASFPTVELDSSMQAMMPAATHEAGHAELQRKLAEAERNFDAVQDECLELLQMLKHYKLQMESHVQQIQLNEQEKTAYIAQIEVLQQEKATLQKQNRDWETNYVDMSKHYEDEQTKNIKETAERVVNLEKQHRDLVHALDTELKAARDEVAKCNNTQPVVMHPIEGKQLWIMHFNADNKRLRFWGMPVLLGCSILDDDNSIHGHTDVFERDIDAVLMPNPVSPVSEPTSAETEAPVPPVVQPPDAKPPVAPALPTLVQQSSVPVPHAGTAPKALLAQIQAGIPLKPVSRKASMGQLQATANLVQSQADANLVQPHADANLVQPQADANLVQTKADAITGTLSSNDIVSDKRADNLKTIRQERESIAATLASKFGVATGRQSGSVDWP